MSAPEETTALLGYGRGSQPRTASTPPLPRRSVFEEVDPLQQSRQKKQSTTPGISTLRAVCYILGVFGVVPIIALPGAIAYCGWVGFILAIVLVATEVYTAVLLGKTWLMMEVFWPREATMNRRNPYPALAEKAGGTILRRIVAVMQDLALFGAAVPFTLIAAESLQGLVAWLFDLDFSFCYWLFITTALLTPLFWFGTPKDLGIVTWIGASSVIVVSVLTLISLILDSPSTHDPPPAFTTWTAAAYCFGAIAFQFDIHPMILTVQMDMKKKSQLPLAIIIAFVVGMSLFITISGVAFSYYGDGVKPIILHNLSQGPLLYANMAIVALQVLMCVVLGSNALFQDLENTLQIPDEFGWRRICLRTAVVLLILFVCESVPHFGVAIELVGGLLVTPFIFVFPPVFHILIKQKASGRIDVKDIVVAGNVITLGVLGCIAATTESFIQLSQLKEFAPPCYINISAVSTYRDASFPS
ncbi:uncharacterized protein LOC135207218 [Macrobrachium nipponense]|uniref:uncharacterized protein LOC135207218 n=1 Tax=Macrobrachium nipponense TaxID=159736 RepID=UPI0030C8B6BD